MGRAFLKIFLKTFILAHSFLISTCGGRGGGVMDYLGFDVVLCSVWSTSWLSAWTVSTAATAILSESTTVNFQDLTHSNHLTHTLWFAS